MMNATTYPVVAVMKKFAQEYCQSHRKGMSLEAHYVIGLDIAQWKNLRVSMRSRNLKLPATHHASKTHELEVGGMRSENNPHLADEMLLHARLEVQ